MRNLAVSWLGLRGPFPYHYFCERNKQLSRGLSIQFIGFWSNIIVFEGEYCISLTKNSTCMTYYTETLAWYVIFSSRHQFPANERNWIFYRPVFIPKKQLLYKKNYKIAEITVQRYNLNQAELLTVNRLTAVNCFEKLNRLTIFRKRLTACLFTSQNRNINLGNYIKHKITYAHVTSREQISTLRVSERDNSWANDCA